MLEQLVDKFFQPSSKKKKKLKNIIQRIYNL